MALDLKQLVAPKQCALLMMECQRGVIGGEGRFNALADAVARHDTVEGIRRLLVAARAAGVPAFHLTTSRRADGGGSAVNCLLMASARKSPPLIPGSPQHAVVAPLVPVEGDYVVNRSHGLTPFHAGELDQLLRNLGVRTVVVAGVSVNIGITGMTIEAVNCGYQVVIPRQAVAGTPDEYVESVMQNTLRLLATITTVDDVVGTWKGNT